MNKVIKVGDQNELVKSCDYPDYAKFPFEFFNPVQSRIFEFYDKDCNAVVASMTSSGKTVSSEMLAACQIRKKGGKILYLAPMKALAKEKYDDWTKEDHHFADLKISICTGDYRLTEARQKELKEADVIILTSEMLNSRCRNMASEKNDFLLDAKICIVDEAHLLTVPGRGDHLEVGLMNLSKLNKDVRFILLSATMPNVDEIAEWVSESLSDKETYLILSKFRPCPLGVHYESYHDVGKYDDQELEKIQKTLEIIEDHPDDKFLLFVHTKKTGELLKNELKKNGMNALFHSADLTKEQREKLEVSFKDKGPNGLQYLIATSTIAWGCHAEDSLISMADGSLKKIQNIEIGDSVFSYNGINFTKEEVLHFELNKKDKTFYKIELESGQKTIVTSGHEFYSAVNRDNIQYNLVENIKKGDMIAVPSRFNQNSNIVSDDFGYLCGYIIGDGCITKNGNYADGKDKLLLDISFGNHESSHIDYVNNLIQGYCNLSTRIKVKQNKKDNVFHITTKKRSVVDNFKHLFKHGRKNGTMSLLHLDISNMSYLKGLIQGLFDSDGGFSSHSNGNTSIEFTNISYKLVKELHQLLFNFGVKSSIGKKKMKPSVINGRFQKVVRKYIYRIRIYGNDVLNYINNVSFRHSCKFEKSQQIKQLMSCKEIKEKDFIPLRKLIDFIPSNILKNDFKCDKWNLINKQEISRNNLRKICEKHENQKLHELCYGDIRWAAVKNIKKIKCNKNFYDIEVANNNNYVADGFISHNCNLPARRVIILGMHRGISEVETYDIWQMAGRAGRPGFDPRGDVYILVPESKEDKHRARLQNPQNIDSKLLDNVGGHYKTLAFHIVSEIHHGRIKTKEDVKDWYSKTLANFQSKGLNDSILNSTIELLIKCGAIKEEDGIYKVTSVGMVSSMFYYSPFDVADLRKNFMALFKSDHENEDLWISMALGNVDSIKMGIVSRSEREDMSSYQSQINRIFGKDTFLETAVKGGFAYYSAMNGSNSGSVATTMRMLQWDFPRLMQVINAIDSFGCKWGKSSYFKELQSRVLYGVKSELVDFVKLPDIGKVRAERLWSLGFRSLQDIVNKSEVVRNALNFKQDKVDEIVKEAKKLILLD